MPKIRRAPQYLKEISSGTVYNEAGGSQGDYADEWDYAESPNGNAREDWTRAHNNPNANYLGWWKRGNRGVFYFGDNRRTSSTRDAWAIYDWYHAEANKLNHAIDVVNGLPDVNVNSATASSSRLDLFMYPNVTINQPRVTKHAVGIKRWLDNKANEVNKAIYNYNDQIRGYNDKIFVEKLRIQSEQRKEEERRRLEKEEKETKRFYELKGTIDDTARRLTANINQLREDFFGAMKKQGDLFSEMSSVREKDNADTIAQFNEALMENSKLEISLQQDVSQLKSDTNKQNEELTTLGKQFRDSSSKISSLSNELSFLQEKVKNINKDFIDDISVYKREQELQNKRMQGNVASIAGKVQNQRNQFERLENEQKNTHNEVFGIQKKLNDNSLMYVQDKEKILSEIENLKNGTVDFENKKAELESKLVALGEKHDAVKTELLKQLEKLQNLNQTQFDALKTENKKREDKHEKDISQLRREHDITDREVARLKDEAGIAQNAFSSLKNNYENLKKSQENLTQKQTAEIVVLRQNLDPLVKKTKTLYDIYSNQQNLRRQDSIRVAPKRAKQYDAAKQFLNNYLATMFKQFG